MFVLANMWFQTLMRTFFFNIDKIVFNFISTIYELLITIARTSILTQADIADMADRIYKLLAVFMIFKVTFSLIMYVVNPDDFSDKNKGISKLGTNIVISLALLILTPYIFSYAYQLQTIILEDNSLSVLIFGDENNTEESSAFETAGDKMAYITMSPFFTPNYSIDELYSCVQLKTSEGEFNKECSEGLKKLVDDDGKYFSEQTKDNYIAGVKINSLGLMFRQDIATATTSEDEKEYIIDYKYLFSTVVGVVIVLLLVTFCMDVALRSIKLAFLQLIAPIPIISYVDPKSGKDGMFKKWYQMCFKTYISLFIRLLAIYFAAYIIGRIDKMVDIIDGSYVSNLFVKIFIIIGVLMFAKQLPKMLEGLGIKLDGGGFTLNPIKKFQDQALGGKQIVGARRGLAAGAMVGTAGMLTGAGVGRSLSATVGGLKAGIKGKKFGEIRKDQATKNAEMRRAIASGSTFLGRRSAELSGFFGTPGRLGQIEHDKLSVQNNIDNLEAQKKVTRDKITPKKVVISKQQAVKSSIDGMESYATSLIEGGKAGEYSKKYKQLGINSEYLTNNIGQKSSYTIKNASGDVVVKAGQQITEQHAVALQGETQRYSKKIGREAVMNELLEGKNKENGDGQVGINDLENFQAQKRSYDKDVSILNEAIDEYNRSDTKDIEISKISDTIDNFGDLHEQSGDLDISTKDIQTSIKNQETEIERIDNVIASEQVKLQELNADEKQAKSNVEVTHSTQGGPANPRDIKASDSTVGPRTGGPGSGMGPMGPMGPGGGPGGPGM